MHLMSGSESPVCKFIVDPAGTMPTEDRPAITAAVTEAGAEGDILPRDTEDLTLTGEEGRQVKNT